MNIWAAIGLSIPGLILRFWLVAILSTIFRWMTVWFVRAFR